MITVTLVSLQRRSKLFGPAFCVIDDEKGASQGHRELIAKSICKTRSVTVLHTSLLLETHKLSRHISL